MPSVDGGEVSVEEQRDALDDLYRDKMGVRTNKTKPARRKPLNHQRKGKPGRSPVADYVRSLGDYKITSEVAEILGMSEQWVRKAAAKRWTQAPSHVAPFGDTHVNLYSDEDIEALREYLNKQRTVYKRDEYPEKEA